MGAYLAGLDAVALASLLRHRPEALVEPTPRTLDELAQRLNGSESLTRALVRMDHDEMVTARAVALLGAASPTVLAARLHSDEQPVREVLQRLCGRGLAFSVDGTVGLPERLAAHFATSLAGFRTLAVVAGQARVDDLRIAIGGLGADPGGLTKPRLVALLGELLADPAVVTRAVSGLPVPVQEYLQIVVDAGGRFHVGGRGPASALASVGLVINGELPREVVVALMFDERDRLTGRPELPASADPVDDGRAGADTAVLSLTGLLDGAVSTPFARLKKGGVGTRERTRLASRLGVTDPALWIDIAHAADLLAAGPDGYGPTADFGPWREQPTVARWAGAALAWFGLDVAPTCRESEDGEVAPPLPMPSAAGHLRRALLRAAADGRSVRGAAAVIDWFCPLSFYDDIGRDLRIVAALHEATRLGVISGDRLAALGELLVALADRPADELAARAADLLPETRGLLVLQSDLTAVVSGQVDAAAARLLAACAVPERGVATTWRFGPASVRGALDSGWAAEDLRTGLAAVSGRPLPQPLDYLLSDVARRHGTVRLRGSRVVLTGPEAELTEILHTRSLTTLHLSRLAPTVLSSPLEPDAVLAKLRAAGFAPMPEDADGLVVLPERPAEPVTHRTPRPARPVVEPAELARRLLHPSESVPPVSDTHARIAALARHLDTAEIALLTDALETGRDVRIQYRNSAGNRSVRDIAPREFWDRRIDAWCYLRSAEREFLVAEIESVGPVG